MIFFELILWLHERLSFKTRLDIEVVNLDADEWSSDINNVTSVLKLWFRELPDPLFTQALHQGFIEAASTYTVPNLITLSIFLRVCLCLH